MPNISPLSLVRNGDVKEDAPPSVEQLRSEVERACGDAVRFVEEQAVADGVTFRDFERAIVQLVYAFGRAIVVLFLALREQRVMRQYGGQSGARHEWLGRRFRVAPAIARNLVTLFGVVRYFRTYMREVADKDRHGFHPLDQSLGLSGDRFSWNVLSKATRLATQLSFAVARSNLTEFLPHTPSTEVIEQSVLGFGSRAQGWFEHQPTPEGDGEVLVIEIDGKAVPTATDAELKRRRGKRRRQRYPTSSPRHRGRQKRRKHPKAPRRKKGDKAKNGKVATMVVMYTLKRRGTRRLEGPINRRHYASFGPKRHAFAFAGREAKKRGFGPDSGRLVQFVSDGDNDYAALATEYLPHAEQTIDCYHVFEKLWEAGGCLFKEGSAELKVWVDEQKTRLFDDDVEAVLDEVRRRRELISKKGPGNKGRRARLQDAHSYLCKRAAKIRYGSLRRRDLVLSTGIVEGAVKNLIGRRCDHGGMRWIKERAQAILQLRCIEANGDWQAFERYVHDNLHLLSTFRCSQQRLQTAIPAPLPKVA